MRFRSCGSVLLLMCLALPLAAQTQPAATQGGLPLMVGGGVSDYNIDFGGGRRMMGFSAWADWGFSRLRWRPVQGFGVEATGHDIRLGIPAGFSRMREDSLLAGPTYTLRRSKRVHPYAKYLLGVSSIDFPPYPGGYDHDTRTISALGGGVDVHAHGNFWLRGDYEYQRWKHIFGQNALTPNGFTLGLSYDFRRR